MKMRSLALLCLLGLLSGLVFSGPAAAQLAPGWTRFDLEVFSTYYDVYVPASLDTTKPAPVVLFLHRAGAEPIAYREALQTAADQAKVVLALPLGTSNLGWGFPNDAGIVNGALEHLGEELDVNEFRVSLAGHGDGASFALERVLDPATSYSAFFGVGASIGTLPAAQELEYLPPVRLYYGQDDPNRAEDLEALRSGLEGRGISVEVEVLSGNDADDLPAAAIEAGLAFLASKSRGGLITQFGCENGEDVICLTEGRFKVTVAWETSDGAPGVGKVANLRSDGSGLFWFFNPKNWELLVKVLNACDINEHFWVFSAASTNLAYTLTVEDLLAQTSVVYTNPQGQAAPAINDTAALPTCGATAE